MASPSKPRWIVADKELSIENFKFAKKYRDCVGAVVVSNEMIMARFTELAHEIVEYYQDRPFTILVVLKGAVTAFSDLVRCLTKVYEESEYENNLFYEFVQLKSYENTGSTGNVEVTIDKDIDLHNKEILIVEDIVDTGHSMRTLLRFLETKGPKSVRMFSYVLKEGRTDFEFPIEYVGFLIPNKFVIGYGMDFNQYFRDIPHLCTITKKGIEKFKV